MRTPASSNGKNASIRAQTPASQGLKESLNNMQPIRSNLKCESTLQPEMEWTVMHNHLSNTVTFTNIVSS